MVYLWWHTSVLTYIMYVKENMSSCIYIVNSSSWHSYDGIFFRIDKRICMCMYIKENMLSCIYTHDDIFSFTYVFFYPSDIRFATERGDVSSTSHLVFFQSPISQQILLGNISSRYTHDIFSDLTCERWQIVLVLHPLTNNDAINFLSLQISDLRPREERLSQLHSWYSSSHTFLSRL